MTTDWVWKRARTGAIPSIPLGRCRRFREEAIGEWLRRLEDDDASS
jgi:hypothetical protein